MTDWNNKIDSYYCGKNVWYNLCDSDNPADCDTQTPIASGAGHMRNPKISWGDRLSIVTMGPYDSTIMGAVTLFYDDYCTGNSARLYWNPDDPVGGVYNARDMT